MDCSHWLNCAWMAVLRTVPPFAAFAPVSASRAFLPFGVVQLEQIALYS
jgi:hypothetical protein